MERGPQPGTRNDPERLHERSPDPQEGADRPLEEVPEDAEPDPGPAHEPGAGEPRTEEEEPHHSLNNPAQNPDPTTDGDPYEEDPDEQR